jgi:hypothetical protein
MIPIDQRTERAGADTSEATARPRFNGAWRSIAHGDSVPQTWSLRATFPSCASRYAELERRPLATDEMDGDSSTRRRQMRRSRRGHPAEGVPRRAR